MANSKLFLLLLLPACVLGTDETDTTLTQPVQARCELLEGRRFSTVELQEDCGPAPAGSQLSCRWHVSFDAQDAVSSAFHASWSDVGDSGAVRCAGNVIVDEYGRERGTHDASTDVLVWNGIAYAAQ